MSLVEANIAKMRLIFLNDSFDYICANLKNMNLKKGGAFFLLYTISLFVLSSCKQDLTSFTELTSEAGIDFMYNFGDFSYENILESSGSGITVFDYDADGWMDLYMMNGTWLEGISDEEGKVFESAGRSG